MWMNPDILSVDGRNISGQDHDSLSFSRLKVYSRHPKAERTKKRKTETRDVEIMVDYFSEMKEMDPKFFYAIEVDKGKQLKHCFWADRIAQSTYYYFGDTVTFATKRFTNQSNLLFAYFTGANHHGQPVLFGCGILNDEFSISYEWLFERWLEAVLRCPPEAIITNYHNDIKIAVARVLPYSFHRFCMHHILEELSEFREEVVDPFVDCISSCKTAEEFEKCWKKLLIENDLEDHDWFDSLYDTRQKWVPAYLKHVFFAGISAEKRSQSMELFFDKYVSKNTTLLEFVLQYERYLARRRHEERKADLETQQSQPTLKTLFVLEKHIREIYTPTIFKKFQDELWKSTVYKLICVEDNGEVRKYEVEKGDQKSKRTHVVQLEIIRKKANCSCLRFEFEGIPCRHVLSVLRHAGVWYVPDHYILKRWARYPTKGFTSNINGIKVLGGPSDSSKFRYNDLYCIANKCVTDGATSKSVYRVAKQWLNKCMIEVTKAKGEIK